MLHVGAAYQHAGKQHRGNGENLVRELLNSDEVSLRSITKRYVSELERELIVQTLYQTAWNRKQAAEKLDVSYKTLLNRMQEFRLSGKTGPDNDPREISAQ